jgi:hypothetical protein
MQRFGKNILACFVLLVFAAVFSCETEPVIFTGSYYVRFTEPSAFARESVTDIIEIKVHNASPSTKEDLTISYSVEGSAREGVDYEFVTEKGFVVIPEGEWFGTIKIRLINNANNILRSQNIQLILRGVNDSELLVGQGMSGIGDSFTFTIFDDCLLSGRFLGTVDEQVLERDIMVTSDDCETYLLSNWDIGFDNSLFDYQLSFIDVGDNTIIIPEQESSDLPEESATIKGFGTVDLLSRKITLTVQLVDENIETTFTLIPD